MSDYCKCSGCKHIDPNERSGYKWYCTWYRRYEDPDDVHECSHYEGQGGGGCFLTTACCQYKGLPDDCYELTVLRKFRDGYLLHTNEGKELVDEYYRIAPSLVQKIDCREERNAIYENMYTTICTIVEKLEHEEYKGATDLYRKMVKEIQHMD